MNLTSNNDYAKSGGLRCPNCNSRDIETKDTDIHGTVYVNHVTCKNCGGRWDEIMAVTGYDNFEKPNAISYELRTVDIYPDLTELDTDQRAILDTSLDFATSLNTISNIENYDMEPGAEHLRVTVKVDNDNAEKVCEDVAASIATAVESVLGISRGDSFNFSHITLHIDLMKNHQTHSNIISKQDDILLIRYVENLTTEDDTILKLEVAVTPGKVIERCEYVIYQLSRILGTV
jgi:hypothetical protein